MSPLTKSTKVDDSLFYIYNDRKKWHHFYRCVRKVGDTVFAKPVGGGPANLKGSTRMSKKNWRAVGVYLYHGEGSAKDVREVQFKDITGKAVHVCGHLVTVPDPVLQEA